MHALSKRGTRVGRSVLPTFRRRRLTAFGFIGGFICFYFYPSKHSLFCALRPLSSAIFSIERSHTPAMAANRACWMLAEGRIAGARSALSTPLTLSSHWAPMACRRGMHTQRAATSLPWQIKVAAPISPSWLRNSRQFSASHAPRHGHLDPPKPGEECVFTVYS